MTTKIYASFFRIKGAIFIIEKFNQTKNGDNSVMKSLLPIIEFQ